MQIVHSLGLMLSNTHVVVERSWSRLSVELLIALALRESCAHFELYCGWEDIPITWPVLFKIVKVMRNEEDWETAADWRRPGGDTTTKCNAMSWIGSLIPVLLPFRHLGTASVSRIHIKRWKQRGDKFVPHNLPLSSDPSAASFVLSAISWCCIPYLHFFST